MNVEISTSKMAKGIQKMFHHQGTPPILVENEEELGAPIFEAADPHWVQENIEAYVMMMNFVNRVQAKGLITTSFSERSEEYVTAFWKVEPHLRYHVGELLIEEALVVLALGMHHLTSMGRKQIHVVAALNSWLPKQYMDYFPIYLSACYEIFTARKLSLVSGRVLRDQEIDSLINEVFDCHIQSEKEGLQQLKRKVVELYVVCQCHQLAAPFVDYGCLISCLTSGTNSIAYQTRCPQEIVSLHRRLTTSEEDDNMQIVFFIEGRSEVDLSVVAKRGTLQVKLESLKRLLPRVWLNDEVINFYLASISDKENQCFSTFFMVKLMQDGGHTNNKEASKFDQLLGIQEGISSLKILAIPIHIDNIHWAVVMVFVKEKIIQYYDSMGANMKDKGKDYVEAIFQYLKQRHAILDTTSWRCEGTCPENIPQQSNKNGDDCGVYCCSYIAQAFHDIVIPSTEKELEMRRKQMALTILKSGADS